MGSKADSSYRVAVSRLTNVLGTTPTYAEAYQVLMRIYAMKGEHEKMWGRAQTMVRVLPDDPRSFLYAGYAGYKMGLLLESEMHFEQALSLMDDTERVIFKDVKRVLNKEQSRRVHEDSSDVVDHWSTGDPFLLTDENERILDHYSRLVFADLIFSEPKLKLRGWDSERGGYLCAIWGSRVHVFYDAQCRELRKK